MINIADITNTVICADCLDIMRQLPDKCVDLVLTDPPYGIDYNNGDLANNRESVFGGDKSKQIARPILNDGRDEAIKLFEEFLQQAKRILKNGACCCCCCGGGGGPLPLFAEWTLLMDKYIGFKQAVVWDKGGLGMGIHYRRNYEFMLIAQKGVPAHRWNGGNKTPNVVRINKIIPSAKQHPTEKPVLLFSHFIKLHSNRDDLVLDCFSGHGVTAIACLETGRNYICIEKEPDYVEIINKRIAAWKEQGRLFA